MNPSELLKQLRDLQTPPEPGWWPPAIGWWLFAIITLVVLGWLLVTIGSAWRRWRQRQRQLHRLRELCLNCPTAQLAAELSILLRRLALSRFPREQVAGLYGEDWLRFLNRSAATDQFTHGPGRALLTAPYQPTVKQTDGCQTLPRLAERWIRLNF